MPARRNFLKSNTLELKYIIEEFFRISLVNPDIAFTFYNQDKVLFQLPAGNLKQRIINLYGPAYAQRLIPVEQQTELVNISGFLGKPEFAKKTRGEQYFFTNGRFMKSPYLHHAVESAFKELIPDDSVPSYFIYMEVDPQTIDVNIHPTKTEINFQDIKSIYAILHAAVKQSIGKFNVSPTLDFDVEQSINIPFFPENRPIKQPTITINPNYNPFEKRTEPQTKFPFSPRQTQSVQGWQDFYSPAPPPAEKFEFPSAGQESKVDSPKHLTDENFSERKRSFQVANAYIITHTQSGVVILDQQNAHERILYERILDQKRTNDVSVQRQLIPQTITLSPDNAQLFLEWKDYFTELGFEINDFGKGSFVIHAIPVKVEVADIGLFIESLLESLKTPGKENKMNQSQILAKTLAKKLAVKRGKRLQQQEIDSIIENLFACRIPDASPDGKPTMIMLAFEELNRKFKI